MPERGDLEWVADISEGIRRVQDYLKGTTYREISSRHQDQ